MRRLLLLQKSRLEKYFVMRDGSKFQEFQQFFLFFGSHQLKRCPVVEHLSGNGIDVFRNEVYLLIIQEGKGRSFGDDAPDQCVIILHVRFLPGGLRIAIEQSGPSHTGSGELQIVRTFEFHAVVCQDQRKQFLKGRDTEPFAQTVEDVQYALFGSIGQQEYQHKITLPEYERQKRLLSRASGSLDRVHLYDVCFGILLHIGAEAVERPPFTVFIFQFRCDLLRMSDAVAHLSGQIDVSEREDIEIDVVIERLLAAADLISV